MKDLRAFYVWQSLYESYGKRLKKRKHINLSKNYMYIIWII